MALRSKNFVFQRIAKDGSTVLFPDSDSWYDSNNDYHWSEVSMPLEAAGYYGVTTGLHTISFCLRNFIGRIYVQATLSSTPTEDDWFNIKFNECCNYFIQFDDQRILNPDGEFTSYNYGTTGTFAENLIGNFTYLRVGVDRTYISEEPTLQQKQVAGKLDEILINF